jgi:hypothetical protein
MSDFWQSLAFIDDTPQAAMSLKAVSRALNLMRMFVLLGDIECSVLPKEKATSH